MERKKNKIGKGISSSEKCDIRRKKGSITINLVQSLAQLKLNLKATHTHAYS